MSLSRVRVLRILLLPIPSSACSFYAVYFASKFVVYNAKLPLPSIRFCAHSVHRVRCSIFWFFSLFFQHFDECVGKLLFGLPARLPPHAQETIQPGNPMFLWDPGNGLVLGIFRAVSGLTELIDRTAWARSGMETPLPWQVCVLLLLRIS